MGTQERVVPDGGSERSDDQRTVDLAGMADDLVILPDTTVDDTDAGWGEYASGNDARLLADRPPHWG